LSVFGWYEHFLLMMLVSYEATTTITGYNIWMVVDEGEARLVTSRGCRWEYCIFEGRFWDGLGNVDLPVAQYRCITRYK
jgi:hypothetical protein